MKHIRKLGVLMMIIATLFVSCETDVVNGTVHYTVDPVAGASRYTLEMEGLDTREFTTAPHTETYDLLAGKYTLIANAYSADGTLIAQSKDNAVEVYSGRSVTYKADFKRLPATLDIELPAFEGAANLEILITGKDAIKVPASSAKQVKTVELPAGTYDITVNALDANGNTIAYYTAKDVAVTEGKSYPIATAFTKVEASITVKITGIKGAEKYVVKVPGQADITLTDNLTHKYNLKNGTYSFTVNAYVGDRLVGTATASADAATGSNKDLPITVAQTAAHVTIKQGTYEGADTYRIYLDGNLLDDTVTDIWTTAGEHTLKAEAYAKEKLIADCVMTEDFKAKDNVFNIEYENAIAYLDFTPSICPDANHYIVVINNNTKYLSAIEKISMEIPRGNCSIEIYAQKDNQTLAIWKNDYVVKGGKTLKVTETPYTYTAGRLLIKTPAQSFEGPTGKKLQYLLEFDKERIYSDTGAFDTHVYITPGQYKNISIKVLDEGRTIAEWNKSYTLNSVEDFKLNVNDINYSLTVAKAVLHLPKLDNAISYSVIHDGKVAETLDGPGTATLWLDADSDNNISVSVSDKEGDLAEWQTTFNKPAGAYDINVEYTILNSFLTVNIEECPFADTYILEVKGKAIRELNASNFSEPQEYRVSTSKPCEIKLECRDSNKNNRTLSIWETSYTPTDSGNKTISIKPESKYGKVTFKNLSYTEEKYIEYFGIGENGYHELLNPDNADGYYMYLEPGAHKLSAIVESFRETIADWHETRDIVAGQEYIIDNPKFRTVFAYVTVNVTPLEIADYYKVFLNENEKVELRDEKRLSHEFRVTFGPDSETMTVNPGLEPLRNDDIYVADKVYGEVEISRGDRKSITLGITDPLCAIFNFWAPTVTEANKYELTINNEKEISTSPINKHNVAIKDKNLAIDYKAYHDDILLGDYSSNENIVFGENKRLDVAWNYHTFSICVDITNAIKPNSELDVSPAYYKVYLDDVVLNERQEGIKQYYHFLKKDADNATVKVEAFNKDGILIGQSLSKTINTTKGQINSADITVEETTAHTASFSFVMPYKYPIEIFYDGENIRDYKYSGDENLESGRPYIDNRTLDKGMIIVGRNLAPGEHKLELQFDDGTKLTHIFRMHSNIPATGYYRFIDANGELKLEKVNGMPAVKATYLTEGPYRPYQTIDIALDIPVEVPRNHDLFVNTLILGPSSWVYSDFDVKQSILHLTIKENIPTADYETYIYIVSQDLELPIVTKVNLPITTLDEERPEIQMNSIHTLEEYCSDVKLNQPINLSYRQTGNLSTKWKTRWYVDGKQIGSYNASSIHFTPDEARTYNIELKSTYGPGIEFVHSRNSIRACYVLDLYDSNYLNRGSVWTPSFSIDPHINLKEISTDDNSMFISLNWNDQYGDYRYRYCPYDIESNTCILPSDLPEGITVDVSFAGSSNDIPIHSNHIKTTIGSMPTERPEIAAIVNKRNYSFSFVFPNAELFSDFRWYIDDREISVEETSFGTSYDKDTPIKAFVISGPQVPQGSHKFSMSCKNSNGNIIGWDKTIDIPVMLPELYIYHDYDSEGHITEYNIRDYSWIPNSTVSWYKNTKNGYELCGIGNSLIVPQDNRYNEYLDIKCVMSVEGSNVISEKYYAPEEFSIKGDGQFCFDRKNVEENIPYTIKLSASLNGFELAKHPELCTEYTFEWQDTNGNAIPGANGPELILTYDNLKYDTQIAEKYIFAIKKTTFEHGISHDHLSSRTASFTLNINPSDLVEIINTPDRVFYTYENTDSVGNDYSVAYIGTLVLDDKNERFSLDYGLVSTLMIPTGEGEEVPSQDLPAPVEVIPYASTMAAPSDPSGNESGQETPSAYDILNIVGSFKQDGNILTLSYDDGNGKTMTNTLEIVDGNKIIIDDVFYSNGINTNIKNKTLSLLAGTKPSAEETDHLGMWKLPTVTIKESALNQMTNQFLAPMFGQLPLQSIETMLDFTGTGGITTDIDFRFEKDILRLAADIGLKANLLDNRLQLGTPFNIGGKVNMPYRIFRDDNDLEVLGNELPLKCRISRDGSVMIVTAVIPFAEGTFTKFTFPLVRTTEDKMLHIDNGTPFTTTKKFSANDTDAIAADLLKAISFEGDTPTGTDKELEALLNPSYDFGGSQYQLNGVWTVENPGQCKEYPSQFVFVLGGASAPNGTIIVPSDNPDNPSERQFILQSPDRNYTIVEYTVKNFEVDENQQIKSITTDIVLKETNGYIYRYSNVKANRTILPLEELLPKFLEIGGSNTLNLNFDANGTWSADLSNIEKVNFGSYGVKDDKITLEIDFNNFLYLYPNMEAQLMLTLGYDAKANKIELLSDHADSISVGPVLK